MLQDTGILVLTWKDPEAHCISPEIPLGWCPPLGSSTDAIRDGALS